MKSIESGLSSNESFGVCEIHKEGVHKFEYYKDKDTLLGTVTLTEKGPKLYDVSGFFVDPIERGNGIGTAILCMCKCIS